MRELLLGKKDGGLNEEKEGNGGGDGVNAGCVVPFDRVMHVDEGSGSGEEGGGEKMDVLSLCLGEFHLLLGGVLYTPSFFPQLQLIPSHSFLVPQPQRPHTQHPVSSTMQTAQAKSSPLTLLKLLQIIP